MKRLLPLALLVPLSAAACSSSSHSGGSASSTTTSPAATSTTTAAPNMNLGNPATAVQVTEAGSSLLYPFLQELATPLHAAYANVTLAPAAGGSGKGISDAIAGTTTLGGSDAYLSAGQLSANPGLANIPIAVSSQAVDYNLPGVSGLKLTGGVLAQMYEGKITKWNDPAIAALNSGVNLPATPVVPVRRVDSSGDTFLFTSFLSDTDTGWSSTPGYGTTVNWPTVSGELTAQGNPGMVQTCQSTPGCVAYIGISAQNAAQAANLGVASLKNKDGNFVTSSEATVNSAVAAGAGSLPANLAASLIDQSGAQSYPIVNFEYVVVKDSQSGADLAQAVRDFLAFAIDPNGGGTAANLAKENFVALPSNVVTQVQAAVAKITG